MGSIVGGVVAIILLGHLFGLAFKSKAPNARALIASSIALVAAGVLAGFGDANGGPFQYGAIVKYVPGAVVGFLYLRWHYAKKWVETQA